MLKYLFYTCIAILSLGQLTAVSKTGEPVSLRPRHRGFFSGRIILFSCGKEKSEYPPVFLLFLTIYCYCRNVVGI